VDLWIYTVLAEARELAKPSLATHARPIDPVKSREIREI
jgi:hypothetical protein